MAKRQFTSMVDGYRVTFKYDTLRYDAPSCYSAFIEGLGRQVYGANLADINKKVRESIAGTPKVEPRTCSTCSKTFTPETNGVYECSTGCYYYQHGLWGC